MSRAASNAPGTTSRPTATPPPSWPTSSADRLPGPPGLEQGGPGVGWEGGPAGDHLGVGADQDRAGVADADGAGGREVEGADLQGERRVQGGRRVRPGVGD